MSTERTARDDFQATSDPAVTGSKLLDYRQLYELWERQQWAVQDIDFSQDRVDWHERIDAEERVARMYGLSSFFVGEQRVAAELGPIMRAVPDEVAEVVTGRFAGLTGIRRTHTMVAFEVFSQHDLEALFSIGS